MQRENNEFGKRVDRVKELTLCVLSSTPLELLFGSRLLQCCQVQLWPVKNSTMLLFTKNVTTLLLVLQPTIVMPSKTECNLHHLKAIACNPSYSNYNSVLLHAVVRIKVISLFFCGQSLSLTESHSWPGPFISLLVLRVAGQAVYHFKKNRKAFKWARPLKR